MSLPAFVPALALTLLLSWGSLFYAFTVLAPPLQAELQAAGPAVMGAYSAGLLVWALATGAIGFVLQRWGGRMVMGAGSLLAGLGFVLLSMAGSLPALYAAWAVLGLSMALTLYEPAFAIVVQAGTADRRRVITALTLAGGLASTLFWPLTSALVQRIGWRDTALVYGLMHLLLCAPLHAALLPARHRGARDGAPDRPTTAAALGGAPRRALWLLGACFVANGLLTAALAAHMLPLLQSRGLGGGTAIVLASCIGPMQVAGRLLELFAGHRLDARRLGLATLALIVLALGALALAPGWAPLCGVFVVAYGAGLGLMTIVRATAPLALFGAERYALLSGTLGMPALLARAAGPIGASWLLEGNGGFGTLLGALLALAAFGAWSFARAWAAAPPAGAAGGPHA